MNSDDPKMSVTFTMRVPVKLMDEIRKDFEETGDYNSLSQWFNTASREYLAKRKKERSLYNNLD